MQSASGLDTVADLEDEILDKDSLDADEIMILDILKEEEEGRSHVAKEYMESHQHQHDKNKPLTVHLVPRMSHDIDELVQISEGYTPAQLILHPA
jgi:hypothetical protein